MRAFKKRTIALVLASVVTVVGAFGDNLYKNSLMNISFETKSDGVDMIVQTRSNYDGELSPIRKDMDTYVLMLPETDAKGVRPNLKDVRGAISSVDVQTLPYSNSSKGYTKITVKVQPEVNLNAKKQIYVASENYKYLQSQNDSHTSGQTLSDANEFETVVNNNRQQLNTAEKEKTLAEQRALAEEKAKKEALSRKQQEAQEMAKRAQQQIQEKQKPVAAPVTSVGQTKNQVVSAPVEEQVTPYEQSSSSENTVLLILSIILVLGLIAFFIVRAKDKMNELAGEKINIDVDDGDAPKKEKPKKEKQKNQKASAKPRKKESVSGENFTSPVGINSSMGLAQESEPVAIETVNVVDLDEIFKEQVSKPTVDEDDENAALEDFLSGFSFDEEFYASEQEPDEGYDVEFYEKVINGDSCKFSKDDVEKINKLLNVEINDTTLKNIEKYAVSNPIKKKVSKKHILEEFVTTYSIEQNIVFTREDIGALYKLISVEIDSDFVTNLKTDPQRMKEMQEEMLAKKEKVRKPSEILTLNVKDMLPDLSEALRKQGGRAIQFEVKPQTVYFSEGYDVSKLSLTDELPDLTKAMQGSIENTSKPSAEFDLVDTSYDVKKLKISSQLPDLTDMLKNPSKYSEPEKEIVEVDENALLNNITNVSFKPFYDGQPIEVINNDSDFEDTTVEDIQKELTQFKNFEIAAEEPFETSYTESDIDDFETLYSNEYFDLDAEKQKEQSQEVANAAEDSVLDEIAISEPETTPEPEPEVALELEIKSEQAPEPEPEFAELNLEQELNFEPKFEIQEDSQEFQSDVSEISENQTEEEFEPIVETEPETEPIPALDMAPEVQQEVAPEQPETIPTLIAETKPSHNDLLKKIQTTKERRIRQTETQQSVQTPKPKIESAESSKVIADIKCIYEGETYTVVSSTHFVGRAGCYLAKNDKEYIILGHYGDKLVSLRKYETLKSEKIQSRMSEKLPNDTYRFLVRIGINKFVVDVCGDEIKYVLDL